MTALTEETDKKIESNPFMETQSAFSTQDYYQYAHIESESGYQDNDQESRYLNTSYQPNPNQLDIPLTSNLSNTSSISFNGASTPASKKFRKGSKLFLATSIISAILILALEVYVYAVINIHKGDIGDHERYSEISIYLSLFIFASIYQVALTIVGLKIKSMLLLMSLCLFYCCMLVYTGIQYQEVKDNFSAPLEGGWKIATRATNIATICVLALTLVLQVFLIFFVLRKDITWFQYKKIGADMKIRKMYNVFQIHRILLIFDFFFFLGFTIQFLVIMVAKRNSVEFILTIVVLPLTLILLCMSDIAATREIVTLSCISIVLLLCGCAYVLFKMIRLFTKYTSAYNIALKPGDYFPGRNSLVTFGCITLVLLVLTIIVELIMVTNYNKGLLPIVSQSWSWLPGNSQKYHRKFDAGHSDNLVSNPKHDAFDANSNDSIID